MPTIVWKMFRKDSIRVGKLLWYENQISTQVHLFFDTVQFMRALVILLFTE